MKSKWDIMFENQGFLALSDFNEAVQHWSDKNTHETRKLLGRCKASIDKLIELTWEFEES